MCLACSRRGFLAGLSASAMLPLAGLAQAATCGTKRGLVIGPEFPDLQLRIDTAYAHERMGSLQRYVSEMSYGQVCLDFTFSGWHTLPDRLADYTISPVNLEVDKSRVVKLIQDSIDSVDRIQDFSRFDFVVIFMKARFADYGMVGLCGYPGMLGWSQDIPFKTRSGQKVPGGVAIFTVSAHTGTLFHDCAHVWGGVKDGRRMVPCLYDHDLQIQYPTLQRGWANALINMGFWDPMSCHSYKRELPPPGTSSWTKLRLGWLPPGKLAEVPLGAGTTEIRLGALADTSAQTLAIKIPVSESRFVLIENRQPVGDFDPHLPGHGVLIMKADDSIGECRFGKAPVKLVNADPSQPYLTGAAFDPVRHPQWTDPETGIRVTVAGQMGTDALVRVERS